MWSLFRSLQLQPFGVMVTVRHRAQFLNMLVQLSTFTSARAQRAAAVVLTPDWKAKETAVVTCGQNWKVCREKGSWGMRWDVFVIKAMEYLSGELDSVITFATFFLLLWFKSFKTNVSDAFTGQYFKGYPELRESLPAASMVSREGQTPPKVIWNLKLDTAPINVSQCGLSNV